MDYSPTGSSAHEILQARILEWAAMPSSRGSSRPRDPASQADSLPAEPPGKPRNTGVVAYPFSSGSSWPRNWTPALQAESLPGARMLYLPLTKIGCRAPPSFLRLTTCWLREDAACCVAVQVAELGSLQKGWEQFRLNRLCYPQAKPGPAGLPCRPSG